MGVGKPDIDSLVAGLREFLGDRVSTAPALLEQHGRDESWHPVQPPDAVVFPDSAAEIVRIVGLCASAGAPMIPFGAGTSLEGHIAAVHGGVSIDTGNMNNIRAVHQGDMDVVVEPGVRRKQLNQHLRDSGLFFPIDPGADASIGGMTATRASGTNAVRYGTMRENVLGLSAVLADGRLIRTGGRARKSAAGYDLTRLFVGSEGTLGIIVEITLRLYGIPERIAAAVCPFPEIDDAVHACIEIIQSGIPIARVELADAVQLDSINRYSRTELPDAPVLFFEFHGTDSGVREQIESVQAIAAEHGGADFQWASRAEDRTRLWQARHDAHYANMALRPGARAWPTDVCVPISRLAECIAETRADLESSRLLAPIVGHVGDGNFHIDFILDPDDPDEVAQAARLNERLVTRALAMDGTCTGEHGVGLGKMKYLASEHGEGLDVMRSVKHALDPANLMNPGKMLAG